MARLWDKGKAVDDRILRFTVGDDFIIDAELLRYDLEGTRAHAATLKASRLISSAEHRAITRALDRLHTEHQAGKLVIRREDEDCHTVIERRLTELLGPLGANIHTGRSRNDQVATMLRLAMSDMLEQLARGCAELALELCALAKRQGGIGLPGYTHTQRAMPSSVGAWALGYAEVLCERGEAMRELRGALARSALGSAAGYGVPLALDRKAAARAMGFEKVQAVTAVQLNRGIDELAFTQTAQLAGLICSRLGADIVLFATAEFGFVRLAADATTGSSIMPNKANPDLFELIRARAAALGQHPSAIALVLAGLAGGYHRDMQELKRPVTRAFVECRDILLAARVGLQKLAFVKERCEAALGPELYATHAAYRLVREGTPFREAYRKAAASREQWLKLPPEDSAQAADNRRYCQGLRTSIQKRAKALVRG